MSQRILLDRSVTGVEHYVHVSDDELITEEYTPSTVDSAIVDYCQKMRDHATPNKASEMRHAATIPINLYQKWRKEWAENWSDTYAWKTFLVTKLNSSEFKNLKIGVKRL